jgi:microcystin-dependent protein
MQISQNQALFAVIGTFYGGNGVNNFLLPNLQGRVPLHTGTSYVLGQAAGSEGVTLNTSQAGHSHLAYGNATAADQASATGNFWGNSASSNYAAAFDGTMAGDAVGLVGKGLPHPNLSPYLVLNFAIALTGIFPSRS